MPQAGLTDPLIRWHWLSFFQDREPRRWAWANRFAKAPLPHAIFMTGRAGSWAGTKKAVTKGLNPSSLRPRSANPRLFVHGLAVLAALQEKGKLPEMKYAMGLSLGEVTALTAAGVFDFVTGLKVVAERGRLMQLACEKTTGGMAAVIGEERAKVYELCKEFDIEAANFNAPGQIIISGEKDKIIAAVAAAKDRGVKKVMALNVAGAYHSRLMEPARVEFAAYLAGVAFNRPKFTVFSNTTAQVVSEPDQIRDALVKQVVSSVLWEDCMRNCAAAGATEFWECGVGGVLAGMAKRTEKSWVVKSFSEFTDLPA